MNINKIYTLDDRGILYINGKDCKEFLQNIITNDINKVSDNFSCYASLLTPQGKYLFDFIIAKHKNGFFLDCEKQQIENLQKQLNLYKLRSKIEILNLSNEFIVAVITKEKFSSFENISIKPGVTTKLKEDPLIFDPRNICLGGRLIINLEKLYMSIKNLNLKASNSKDYYDYSFKIGIPQINTHKLQNKLFAAEYNLEELNAIDFKKGCFIGQENTARIKLKEKLSKRLFPLKVTKGVIYDNDQIKSNGEELGKVLIGDSYPFGLLKFKSILFDFNKEFDCGKGKIKILKPEWLN